MKFFFAAGFILAGFVLILAGLMDSIPSGGLWTGFALVVTGVVLNEVQGDEFPSNARKVSPDKYRGPRIPFPAEWSEEEKESRYMS